MNEFTIAQRAAIAEALASNYGNPSTREISAYIDRSLPSFARGLCVGSKSQMLKTYFESVSDEEVLRSVQFFLAPELFIGQEDEYKEYRMRVNRALSFVGYEINESGRIKKIEKAKTLTEAQRRQVSLINHVQERQMHSRILKYCREELFENDYYDVVFESVKGIYDTIREMSGLKLDGSLLIDAVFSNSKPMLLINDYSTASEKSFHTGFANLLRGLHGNFRNPAAHEVKIKWQVSEVEVLEILGIVSYVYRVLDNATRTCYTK